MDIEQVQQLEEQVRIEYPEQVDKVAGLVKIFETAYTDGLFLSGDSGAIAAAAIPGLGRSTFNAIPRALRDMIQENVEQTNDLQDEEQKRTMKAMRLQRARKLERRSLNFLDTLLTRIEDRIRDEDIADKNLAELAKVYIDLTRNGVTPEYVPEKQEDEDDPPRLPVPPIMRLAGTIGMPNALIAESEFTAETTSGAKVKITYTQPDTIDG